MLTLALADGSNIKNMSSPAQLGDACSQQIHHHHKMAYKVQINVAPESAQQKSEQLSFGTDDFASKLFKCISTTCTI